jgi:hypothetical protein
MASALSDLIKKLSRSRDGVLSSSQLFPPLNLEQVYKELRLAERGKENGSRNIPSSASDVEDTAESDILAEIERRARKAAEDYRSQLELYEGRIRNAADLTGHEAMINAAGEGALVDFKVQSKDDIDFLHNVVTEVQGREQEFSAFKKKNRLDRNPYAISKTERIIRGLFIAIFILVESLLNGFFFAKGSERGIIGGFIQAITLSVLNVGPAIIFALYGRPLLYHIQRSKNILGVLFTLCYASWAIGLNLLIGHYRGLFIQKADVVSVSEVASRFISSPLGFDDAVSLTLALLGMGLSILTLIDAAGLTDPYPGFRAIGERRRLAAETYASKKAQCFGELSKRRDQAIEEMTRLIELIRSAEYEYRRSVDGRSRLHALYCSYLQHLGDSYIRLLQGYCEDNIRFRSEPPPARFSRRPPLPPFLNDPQQTSLPHLTGETESKGAERMEFFVTAVNDEYDKAVEKYQSISSLANPEGKNIAT